MTEWWTYSLRDLLLFSPRTYYRLFELYNIESWPLQLAALALGGAILALWRQRSKRATRSLGIILALCWLWVAWAFHWQRYAPINWAATYFASAFALQALLLLWAGLMQDRLIMAPPGVLQQRVGLLLFLFALFAFPLKGYLFEKDLVQAEIFGMAPDPTALATLGILLLYNVRFKWMLFPIPVAWCLLSGATLWAMDAPDFAIAPLAALLAVGGAITFFDKAT